MNKQRVNLTIDSQVLQQARGLDINLSRFVEEKLSEYTREARARQWLEENREAIRQYNTRVERDGPVLQDFSLL